MQRALTSLAVVVLAGLGATPVAASTSIDWNDRSTVDIELPSGWRIESCDGDALFLCMHTPSGEPDGTIMLDHHDLPAGADTSQAAVEDDAAELYRVIEEDRRVTCGSDYELEPHAFREVTVGGIPGYRYGFTLRDPQGAPTELMVLHITFDAGRRIMISTAFSDPAGCPGEDPERDELPITAYGEVEPHLDELVAASILPTDFDRGPLCRPGQVPAAGFADADGNVHEHLIDCLTWFGITKGYSATMFGVDDPVTRGQLATVIARLIEASGEPLPAPTDQGFVDIAPSAHADRINQLAAAGVVDGTSATTFEPDRRVSRAQAAAMVVAAHEHIVRQDMYDAGTSFGDVQGVHAGSISRAVTARLMYGTEDQAFEPSRSLRRDQMASLVGRTLNRLGSARFVQAP